MLALAVSLASVAAASLTAWQRCGRGNDCSAEIGLAVFAFAPACVIALVMLFLLGWRAGGSRLRAVILAAGVALASLPLAAFLLQDWRLLPLFAFLLTAAMLLAVRGESEGMEQGALDSAIAPSAFPSEPSLPTAVAGPRAAPGTALVVLPLVDGLAESTRSLVAIVDLLESHCRANPPRRRESPHRPRC